MPLNQLPWKRELSVKDYWHFLKKTEYNEFCSSSQELKLITAESEKIDAISETVWKLNQRGTHLTRTQVKHARERTHESLARNTSYASPDEPLIHGALPHFYNWVLLTFHRRPFQFVLGNRRC